MTVNDRLYKFILSTSVSEERDGNEELEIN